MRTVLGSSLVNQVERGRTTIRGGAGTRTHTSGSQAPRLHKFKAGMTDRAPEGRSGETAIKSRVKILASPPLGVRSADRPLPAPFRTGLPGWYSRPFRFGGCPLPLHVPRVPPSRVFRFHAESEFRCARPKKRVPTLRTLLRVPDVHAPAALHCRVASAGAVTARPRRLRRRGSRYVTRKCFFFGAGGRRLLGSWAWKWWRRVGLSMQRMLFPPLKALMGSPCVRLLVPRATPRTQVLHRSGRLSRGSGLGGKEQGEK